MLSAYSIWEFRESTGFAEELSSEPLLTVMARAGEEIRSQRARFIRATVLSFNP
jgi:hypothetical protein